METEEDKKQETTTESSSEQNSNQVTISKEEYEKILQRIQHLEGSKPQEPIRGTVQEPKQILTNYSSTQENNQLTYEQQLEEYSKEAMMRRQRFQRELRLGDNEAIDARDPDIQRMCLECIILEGLESNPKLRKAFGEDLYKDLKECRYITTLEKAVGRSRDIKHYSQKAFETEMNKEMFGLYNRTLEQTLKNINRQRDRRELVDEIKKELTR